MGEDTRELGEIRGKLVIPKDARTLEGMARITPSGEYAVFTGKPFEVRVAEEARKMGYGPNEEVPYMIIIEPKK
jgi:hypothetical protein